MSLSPKYNIGDVILAHITDYTLLGEEFIHHVKGTIVGTYFSDTICGYDVKLTKAESFECLTPNPKSTKYLHYTQPTPSELGFQWMDIIFVEVSNISRHFPSQRIPEPSLLLALRHLWGKLIFREVKTVIRKEVEMNVEYNYIDNHGYERKRHFHTLKEAFENVPREYHHNIKAEFNNYYGFTTNSIIRNNDAHHGHEIFFSKKCYDEINLGFNPTAWFSRSVEQNSWPPREGDLICGLVEFGEKGLFFRKWFCCSTQFLTLWTMINQTNHSSLYFGRKIKSFSHMLTELDTKPLHVDYNLPINLRQENYKIHNVETTATGWIDRYQEIARLVFPPGALNKLTPADKFKHKFYQAVMWFES